jgi:membrane-associated phospholipid phosphatase
MRLWEAASVVFFVYVGIAGAPGRRPARSRVLLYLGAGAGALFAVLTSRLPYLPILHDWLAPPALLLLAYWTSGLLFVAPRAAQERALAAFDQRLRIDEIARRLPGSLSSLLEAAYAGVYVLIPLALIVHRWFALAPDAARFWDVILVTDFVCFGFLAFVQTRPPRAAGAPDPWSSRIRQFNLSMLGATSIQVNTFPSGHAAEALAAALLVIGAPMPLVLTMALAALAVSAGTVLGRYHYAADAIAGWIVALAVWALLR